MRTYQGGTGPLADSIIEAARNSNGYVIELGVFTGDGSTAMIQEALADHHSPLHISVDWDHQLGFDTPEVPWWHLIFGDSRSEAVFQKAAEIAQGRQPGLIFIDTDHNYDQMRAELELWGRAATHGTVWLMHDTWMYGRENAEMKRAIIEYAATNGWVYDDYRTDSHGLGRMRCS